MSEWTYNKKPFDTDKIEEYIGFVYEIYDNYVFLVNDGRNKTFHHMHMHLLPVVLMV